MRPSKLELQRLWVGLCCLIAFFAFTERGYSGEIQRENAAEKDRQLRFFETRIRPVFIEHCYECHATDSKELKGSLRVDTRDALLTGGDSGAAIIPGKPDESLLLEALRFDDLEMPPSGKLPKQVIADFRKWIADGAVDPREESGPNPSTRNKIDIESGRQFWAFQPVSPVAPPHDGVGSKGNGIDRFILRSLHRAGLTPNPEASRYALVRRLHFDLTGLPPKPEDIQRFVGDPSEDAWENVVDRLLQSTDFGIHWGRHWLDVARYADSNGSDFNATFHNAWRYRNYVINSFNQDKPFDIFVREQIAGDLMEYVSDEDRSQKIIATGFLMLGTKMLSERDKLKMTMDVVDEQINTVGQAFLGLTLGCARCHDHKFDPIPTEDYYALAGIFKSTRTLQGESQKYVSTWPKRPLPATPEHVTAMKEFEAARQKLREQLKTVEQQKSRVAEQIKKLKLNQHMIVIDDSQAKKIGTWKPSTHNPNYFGKGYIHDDKSQKGQKRVEFVIPMKRSARYEVQISYSGTSGRDPNVPVYIDYAGGAKKVLVNQTRKPSIENLFEPLGIFPFEKYKTARVTVRTEGTVGFVIVDAIRLIEVDGQGQPVKRVETGGKENKGKKDLSELESLERELTETSKRVRADLKQFERQQPKPLPHSLAVDEASQIEDCRVCIRGEHENLGSSVPRGFLKVASRGQSTVTNRSQSGRLELAHWIADSSNPLTARVYVNRVWNHLIGEGLVSTVDNFGSLGSRPSHPELLDFLAHRLMSEGWSTKKLIRHIVLSQTYRMSTGNQSEGAARDPKNRLLWRANRKRLTAESIRDAMLLMGGNLDRSLGGSPVEGLGILVTQNSADQKKFQRQESVLRSIFMPMIRAELPEFLTILDMADPDLVTGKRNVTNVPGQALLLLNSPFVINQAEAIAEILLSSTATSADLEKQIELAYPLVLARNGTRSEVSRGIEFVNSLEDRSDPKRSLSRFIHTLLASIEYRMLD